MLNLFSRGAALCDGIPRREVLRCEGHREAVWCVAVAPDGTSFLSGG